MNFWIILYIIDWFLFIGVALTTTYLIVFAIASLFNKHLKVHKAKRKNRFIILVPAYKQDKVIIRGLKSILGQTYPQRLFDVVVISDHESEVTNMGLAQFPVTLLTPNFEKSTKAKSLQYAILNLPEFKIYDAVIVLDADNIVEPEFLEQVNDAFESAGTKAIQVHRLPQNRDTPSARIDGIFEEINTSIFRRGHITLGLSAAVSGSGIIYDFKWFKQNIMKVRTAGEDKELEAMLMRQFVFVDYFDNIYVYDEKTRQTNDFNKQRLRWTMNQFRHAFKNLRYLPSAFINKQYDLADKIVQWFLMPRILLVAIIFLMSIILPFIYFSLAIKWWVIGFLLGSALALATPDYLVDEHWDKDFLQLPIRLIKTSLKTLHINVPEIRLENVKWTNLSLFKGIGNFKKHKR